MSPSFQPCPEKILVVQIPPKYNCYRIISLELAMCTRSDVLCYRIASRTQNRVSELESHQVSLRSFVPFVLVPFSSSLLLGYRIINAKCMHAFITTKYFGHTMHKEIIKKRECENEFA